MTSINEILERKHISSGRANVLFRDDNGEIRLGRSFPGTVPVRTAKTLLSFMQNLRSESIMVPDRFHSNLESGRYCFSMPLGTMTDRLIPQAPKTLLSLLFTIHERGWLHLDVTCESFRMQGNRPVILLWGDALLEGLACPPPEIGSGAAPTPLSDIYLLGRALMAGKHRIWNGSDRELVENMVSTGVSGRVGNLTIPGVSQGVFSDCDVSTGEVNIVAGGNWKDRDLKISCIASDALARGWLVRVVRCSPVESLMPLPGHRPQKPVKNCADLVHNLFPVMSGVERLLIIDQVEYASEDLIQIIKDLQSLLPPGLTLVVTSFREDTARLFEVEHANPGKPSQGAVEVPLELLKVPSGGFPCIGPSGPCYRSSSPGVAVKPFLPEPEELFAAGGYRALISASGKGLIKCSDTLLARAFFETGNYSRAYELADPDNVLLRARSLLEAGRAEEASHMLKGHDSTGEKLLRASALIQQMKNTEAVEVLAGLSGPEPVLLLTRALDLLGRTAEALPLIQGELKNSEGPDTVRLLCAEAVLNMRTGNYSGALGSAEQAVSTARGLFDPVLLWQSLTERGRVREVTGNWSGAVDDYRLALLYYSENPGKNSRPPLIDLFVLELRTGEIVSASRSFKSLDVRLERSGSTIPADQMTSMLTAYRAVILGLGSMGIPSARRSAALAAKADLTLVHALSLLYLGQLLLQEERYDEGLQALEHARAKAGLMGDRHLGLLADLAMARAGVEIDTGRLVLEAGEMGLKPEELEATAVSSSDRGEREKALLEIMNMPAPLLAIQLSCSLGLPEDPVLRKRILSSFIQIRNLLKGPERERFLHTHSILNSFLEKHIVSRPPSVTMETSRLVADWISRGRHDDRGLRRLASDLGLESLSTTATGAKGEEMVSEQPALYAAGLDLTRIRIMAPIIASLHEGSEGEKPEPAVLEPDPFPEILGTSEAVRNLKTTMLRISPMPVPVLITGETGTGKELVARGLHSREKPTERPFVAVDCGAIADSILEAELFGVNRGAYTGASDSRVGLMEAANGGTLFLDEIGNMSPAIQIKLLRVLETGKVRRLGDTAERTTSFRLLAATNADLRRESAEGTFRSDLFYRLAVMELILPPLRERIEDIPMLSMHFASSIRPGAELSKKALKKLRRYGWPGNIRELRNVVQRAVLLSDKSLVGPENIDLHHTGPSVHSLSRTLESAMAQYVSEVVSACGGNKTEAGRILGCDPKTVRKYLSLS